MKRFFFSRRTALLLTGVLLAFLLLTGTALADTVSLPAGLKTVEAEAFIGDNHITQLQVPQGVTRIETNAFANCYNLVEADLPSSISYIADNAFSGCPYVTVMSEAGSYAESWCGDHQVTFRSSAAATTPGANFLIDFIDSQSIRLLSYLGPDTTVVIPDMIGDEYVWMITEFIGNGYSSAKVWLEGKYIVKDISFPRGFRCNITDLTLPNTVNSVPGRSFWSLRLESVTIPDSVTSIGEKAFHNCKQLTSVNLSPNSRLTEIKNGAFMQCESLQSITLPGTMISIGDAAFKGSGLTSVTMNDCSHPVTIGESAFEDCSSLRDIQLPEGLVSIGPYAFQRSGLTSLSIPTTLTTIDYNAFYRCTRLSSLFIPEDSRLMKLAAYAFCYDYALSGELRMPETLAVISDAAPFYDTLISKLILPDTVRNEYGRLMKEIQSERFNGIPVTYYPAHHFVYDESTATSITYDAQNKNEDNHYIMYTQMICSDPNCGEIKLLNPPVILYEPCDNELEAYDDHSGAKLYEWSRENYLQHYPKKIHVRCKICHRDEILEGDDTIPYRGQFQKDHTYSPAQTNWLFPCEKCDYVNMEAALERAYVYLAQKMENASDEAKNTNSLTQGPDWENFLKCFNTDQLTVAFTKEQIDAILVEVAEAMLDKLTTQANSFNPEAHAGSKAELAEHILGLAADLNLSGLSRTVTIGGVSCRLTFIGQTNAGLAVGMIRVTKGSREIGFITFQNAVGSTQGKKAFADYMAHLAQLNTALWETFLQEYFGQLGQIPGFEIISPKNIKTVTDYAKKIIIALSDSSKGKEYAKELLDEWIGKAVDETVKQVLKKLKPSFFSNKFLDYIHEVIPSGVNLSKAAEKLQGIEDQFNEYKKLFEGGKMTPKKMMDLLTKYDNIYRQFIAEADKI